AVGRAGASPFPTPISAWSSASVCVAATGAAAAEGRVAYDEFGPVSAVDPLHLGAVAVRKALRVDRDFQPGRLCDRVGLVRVLVERESVHEGAARATRDVESKERAFWVVRPELLE